MFFIPINQEYGTTKSDRPTVFDIHEDDTISLKEAIVQVRETARKHARIKRSRVPSWIFYTFRHCFSGLQKNYSELMKTPEAFEEFVPAVRWITDNYYIFNREIKAARENFRRNRIGKLPLVEYGDMGWYPRIFVVVKEIMQRTGCHFYEDRFKVLLEAYQNISPLTIAELWFLPLAIRMCYLETIAIISKRAVCSVRIKSEAKKKFVLSIASDDDKETILGKTAGIIGSYKRKDDPDFLSQIIYMLRERGINDSIALNSVMESGLGSRENYLSVIRKESDRQSGMVSKASVLITGLNRVADLDWQEVFQDICVVDEILGKEKCGCYAGMDIDTKNKYRDMVEKAAYLSGQEEFYIAKKVLDMTIGKTEKKAHVGYYLIGDGKKEFLDSLDIKSGLFKNITAFVINNKKKIYILIYALLSVLFIVSLSCYTFITAGSHGALAMLMMLIPISLIAADLSGSITNLVFTKLLSRKQPPKMNYEKGIPECCRTIVAVPVIISCREDIDRYAEKLEETYLSNRGPHTVFAILADYPDADAREKGLEAEIDSYACEKMLELNRQYASEKNRIFFYFCRYRKWNEKENAWIGWERKRGKLEEFNELLKGSRHTSFHSTNGIEQISGRIKYVITIDSDTDLVSGSIHRLVGVMAHILNRPELSEDGRRVINGYALIQPRIDTRLGTYLNTPFTKMFAGKVGVDPYAYASSDIYQDIFCEGTFVGKGIYDLDVFSRVMSGTIPENAVLSHDLLEGSFVRSGLSSDIQLTDGHPANAISFYKREHRWIRGDWQLLPWIFGRDRLSMLSRWKMSANLIRSLAPPAYLFYLLFIPLFLDWNMLLFVSVIIFPAIFSIFPAISRSSFISFKKNGAVYALKSIFISACKNISRILYLISILPFRAWVSLDAIVRTVYRLTVSRKKLLEWETAEYSEKKFKGSPVLYVKKMHINLWIGAAAIFTGMAAGEAFLVTAGIIFAAAVPYSYLLGVPCRYKRKMLEQKDMKELYGIARKTWRYFEELFNVDNNYLVPDNFQMLDEESTATRTSPTNIGFQLMAFLSARDFGFISLTDFVEMVKKTLSTVKKLKKWHGNLYNWYDVINLEPLYPHYVSTVDSGNFVAYLLTLKQGILDTINKPVFNLNNLNGIKDILSEAGFDKVTFDDMDIEKLKMFLSEGVASIDDKNNAWIDREYCDCASDALSGYIADLDGFGSLERSIVQLCAENNNYALYIRNETDQILSRIENLFRNTHFNLLYNTRKNLFHIGYDVSKREADDSYYDLLASEARITSFIAIAKNEVPKKHWYKLARPLTLVRGDPVLISWNGTMFEYFMPHLILKPLHGTIFDHTLDGVAKTQIRYAAKKKVPFGISESAYYRFDQNLNYQYRAFGIPSLGYKADLSKFLVIAPYASIMSIEKCPDDVIRNLRRLMEEGAYGKFGFYESVDYISPVDTKLRRQRIIKTFMCHHQGMILMALDNFLHDGIHRERFHREPMIRANQFILEETKLLGKIEKDSLSVRTREKQAISDPMMSTARIIRDTDMNYPVTHVMSNDTYQIMIDSSGLGFSKYKGRMVNLWLKDWTDNNYGNYIYIRDLDKGRFYSATYKPTLIKPDSYEVNFYPHKAEFIRIDGSIETKTEIVTMTSINGEIRRVTLKNRGREKARLDITSYMDVILDTMPASISYPAFSKLFIETEYDPHYRCIIATRRQREDKDTTYYLGATCIYESSQPSIFEYDTDRNYFIGRGRGLADPSAMDDSFMFRGTVGEVVEPCISMRTRMELDQNEYKTVSFIYIVTENKDEIGPLLQRFKSADRIDEKFVKAFFDSRLELSYLGLDYNKANAILEGTSCIFYSLDILRAEDEVLQKNTLTQKDLWKFGISGDNPIILVMVDEMSEIDTVKDSVLIYEYMRRNQIEVDLVIVNRRKQGYYIDLANSINDVLFAARAFESDKKAKSVFSINKSDISDDEYVLLMTTADMVLTGKDRILGTRIRNARKTVEASVAQNLIFSGGGREAGDRMQLKDSLRFFNGYGGFDTVNDEYVIILDDDRITPMPWINIIANPDFGCMTSESGMGYTYRTNSRENKLTKWSNDPVSVDSPEIIYIRDNLTNEVFSITPFPVRIGGEHVIRHGYGYTVYEFSHSGVKYEQKVFVPLDENFKYVIVTIENNSRFERNIGLAYYAELVLGDERIKNTKYIVTGYDDKHESLTAYNRYNETYGGEITYLYSDSGITDHTNDKNEFIGYAGRKDSPAGMVSGGMSGKTGCTGSSVCFSLKTNKTIAPDKSAAFVFMFGQEHTTASFRKNVIKYGSLKKAADEFTKLKKFWDDILSVVKVNTPDEKMNIMLNGWLLYQTIVCRMFARTSFYQAGGAFGFRDQLQDCMALFCCRPDMSRDMIIKAAEHQFIEGDVMHWWHPDTGAGIRTKISDDMVWLPYVLQNYISATGDKKIMDEEVHYLEWDTLGDEEYERYGIPLVSNVKGDIYDHAKRAIIRAMKFGSHGLPLIGTGDWNDGMNRVGHEGKGESVWLGWFLYKTMDDFIDLCRKRNDHDFIKIISECMKELQKNIDHNAWDGEWYLRAFFDNGTKIGSKEQDECKIDLISQAWAVISKAGDSRKTSYAMNAVRKYLIDENGKVVSLLSPPFHKSRPNPGYIQGYLRGIRENGGQYTHGAVWAVYAFAMLGDTETAFRIFDMLNPISHSEKINDAERYKLEPYAVCADIYYNNLQKGRGGWSFYTGSSGWLYRAGLEELLGFLKKGDRLYIAPRIAGLFKRYSIEYTYMKTRYIIYVEQDKTVAAQRININGKECRKKYIDLIDDGSVNMVTIRIPVKNPRL